MGKLFPPLRSLRWRLTLSYIALLGALLVGLGAYQYVALRQSLIADKVTTLHDDLLTGESVFRAARVTGTANTSTALERLINAISTASGHTVSVVVYTDSGSVLRQFSAQADGPAPQVDPSVIQHVASSHQQYSEMTDDALIAAFPVGGAAGRISGVVQLSVPSSAINSVVNRQLFLLLLGGIAALIAAGIIGQFLTGRALRPLRRLTVSAGQLASGDLSARSRLVPSDDEIGELTAAFDHMAEQIETAFAAQKESEEQVRRFIADASHELRTPVTALKGYIDVIRRGAVTNPQAFEAAMASMAHEADRMRDLVLDLLTLARIDAQTQPEQTDIDLREVINTVLRENPPGKPAQVLVDLPAQPVMVHCHVSSIETVLRNILVNACKYAPDAAQTWRLQTENGRAVIGAYDAGPGIPAADLPHLFERFYRGEKTRNRGEGGTGLGLSIVQGLIRAQGGDVSISSVEGAGTTVTIWLPLLIRC